MSAVVEAVRARLLELTAAIGIPTEVDDAGDVVVRDGPLVATAQVVEIDGVGVVHASALVQEDAAVTPALLRFVAERSFLFGRLVLVEAGEGRTDVVFRHTLLGDPLTTDVVLQVLGIVISTPQELDLPA